MRKLYENFHISYFQKRIVSADTICRNTVHGWVIGNYIFFQSLIHVDFNLKLRFLIKSSYYIVPSPSTALPKGIKPYFKDGPKELWMSTNVENAIAIFQLMKTLLVTCDKFIMTIDLFVISVPKYSSSEEACLSIWE